MAYEIHMGMVYYFVIISALHAEMKVGLSQVLPTRTIMPNSFFNTIPFPTVRPPALIDTPWCLLANTYGLLLHNQSHNLLVLVLVQTDM